MTDKKENRTKWLHVRLTVQEYNKLHKKFSKTTCKKLSDFARRSLLDKPVTVTVRNQSLDDLMAELITLKSELNSIGINYNQVVKKLNQMNHIAEINTWLLHHESARQILLGKIDEIKLKIYTINDAWLHE